MTAVILQTTSAAGLVVGLVAVGSLVAAAHRSSLSRATRRTIRRELTVVPDVTGVTVVRLSRDAWHCMLTVAGRGSLMDTTRLATRALDTPSRSSRLLPRNASITIAVHHAQAERKRPTPCSRRLVGTHAEPVR